MEFEGIKATELEGRDRWNWIARTGWHGLCPHCGKGHMFKSWLKLADRCEVCGLDFSFATPDDGPAFFVLCSVTFPLIFLTMFIELYFEPPMWVHLVTDAPVMFLSCYLALRPFKGWLVASQYLNRAQEAGTEELASKLRGES